MIDFWHAAEYLGDAADVLFALIAWGEAAVADFLLTTGQQNDPASCLPSWSGTRSGWRPGRGLSLDQPEVGAANHILHQSRTRPAGWTTPRWWN